MRQGAAGTVMYVAATAMVAAVAIPLAGVSVAGHRAPSVGGLVLGVGAIGLLAAVVQWLIVRRTWREDEAIARYVGERSPGVASDLLSTVQLGDRHAESFSADLVQALADQTARRIETLDLTDIVPGRRLRRSSLSLGIAAAAAVIAITTAPDTLSRGWRAVLALDVHDRFDGARTSDTPIVGDVRITLDYPGYTQRPSVTLPASSGDFRAMPGTRVSLRTTALTPAQSAQLLFGDTGDGEVVDMTVVDDELSASFVVTEATAYRFFLHPELGAPLIEETPHSIEIEADAAPVVELYAPADELDVEGRRRIELAYTSEDDYGISSVTLVWDSGAGKTGRKQLTMPREGSRTAQAKFLWDLTEVDLQPGERVTYHVEVADNDDVIGPNIGKSKAYALRVFSPRERHEQIMKRQAELFERMVRVLGARLTVPADDVDAHAAIHKEAQAVVVELGGIVAALQDDKLAARDLVAAYKDMKARLETLAEAEDKLLAALARKPNKRGMVKLAKGDAANVAELETDVLLMADWLDRQAMENVLSLTDEISERRKHLEELFEKYASTGDPAVLEEIEREMRALEAAMAELSRQQGTMSDEVMDRFMNMDALEQQQQSADCLAEVRKLLAAGEAEAAAEAMKRCNAEFAEGKQQLEQSLDELMRDRFAEEQRKLDELTGDLADLAQDEQDIAAEADAIMESYKDRAADLMEDKAKDARSEARKIIGKLRKRLKKIPKSGLTPFAKEELPIAEQRLDDVERMLDDGDLAEALAMAKQAETSIETIEAELGADLDSGDPWNDRTPDAYNAVASALPLARELVQELEKATPSPQEIMNAGDKQRMRKLRRRQQAVRKRAEQLSKKAKGMQEELPGDSGQAMAEGVDQAVEHMKRGERLMKRGDPSGSRQAARDAHDALQRAQEESRGAARQQQQGQGRDSEPVRIPGADEYRAPQEFREEILEAMKKEAPSGFKDQVRRYYEDLIR